MKPSAPRMRLVAVCGAAAGIAFLAACALSNQRVRMLTTQTYPPRPADYEIALTENDFVEPYVEIAHITTRAYEDRLADQLGSVELRRMARELGGDAVVRVARNAVMREEPAYRPGNLFRFGTQFVDKYALSGIVVRFDRGERRR